MPSNGRRRVFITGAGAVSAAGVGANLLWQAARSGQSAVGQVELSRGVANKVTVAAQVKGFEPERYLSKNTLIYADRFSQFALVAADEAITQAKLNDGGRLGSRTAVIIGTGIGGATTIGNAHYHFTSGTRADVLSIPRAMPSAAASQVAIRYGCTGVSFAVSSACASATQAIGIAVEMVRSGVVDRVITGGADATIEPVSFRSWETLRVLTPDFCRPFSKGRNGMVLGEGAGIFILESEATANERGANVLAEILGYGTSTDALDMLRPDQVGAAAAIQAALDDGGISPDRINYINAHGTGTIMNDMTEVQAIRAVFGSRSESIPTSSTKPIHGHALGAAGALELLVTINALNENIAPPTINWLEPDENCLIDAVANEARSVNINVAMSNSFAFGGINAVLIVGKPT